MSRSGFASLKHGLLVFGFCLCGAFSAAPQLRAVVLDNGIDPANLGKGDWIYILANATSAYGGSTASLMAYEKSQGMNYLIIKAGEGDTAYPSAGAPQFTSNLVNSAHAAGLKIFGYTRSYGLNVAGEISVITNAMNLGADGYVIDAESEWESPTLPNNAALAAQLCQGIRAVYPKRFLAHSPFMYIHFHSTFPYKQFGYYCDAVMPQAYWTSFNITPAQCVADMDTDWRNWQNALTGTNVNAIKPIVPVGQGWTPGTNATTGAEITQFVNALKTDANPATAGGYKGVNYFRAELHDADIWSGIAANGMGGTQPIAPFLYNLLAANITDVSVTITWTTDLNSDSVVDYGLANSGYTGSITNASLVSSHSVIITGLTPFTNYHFRARSKVSGTNTTYSGDFPFLTRATGFVPDIILDNTDAAFNLMWSTGTASADKYGADYRFKTGNNAGGYALYSPNFGTSGNFQVYEWHPQGANRSTSATYVTSFYGGTQTNSVNQQINGGKFNLLGTFYFQSGPSGTLKLTDSTIDLANSVMADAVKFVYVGQPAPPAISSQPQNKTTNQGSGVTFSVTATGTPPLTYQWQFNSANIGGATASSYTRSNVQAADAGNYSVVVSNPGGSTNSANAVLAVNAPPSITAQPADQTVRVGSNATFTVTATGAPPLIYQWRFNGTNLPGATTNSYTRANTQTNDGGNYSVVIANTLGSVASSDALLSVTLPQPAEFQSIAQLPDGSLHFVITGDPGSYTIESSSNLTDWVVFTNVVNTNGTLELIDNSSSNSPLRFYRAKQ